MLLNTTGKCVRQGLKQLHVFFLRAIQVCQLSQFPVCMSMFPSTASFIVEDCACVYHTIMTSDLLASAVKLWFKYRNHKIYSTNFYMYGSELFNSTVQLAFNLEYIYSTVYNSLTFYLHYEPSRWWTGTVLLSVPRVRTKHGKAAFSFYAPHTWKKFPENCSVL